LSAWTCGSADVDSGLQIARIAVLERAALTDLYGDRAEVRGKAAQGGKDGLRKRGEAADDAREVVLVLRAEALNGGDAL